MKKSNISVVIDNIKFNIRQKARNDEMWNGIVIFLYLLFGNQYAPIISSIFFTTIISIEVSVLSSDFKSNYAIIILIITVIMYILVELLIVFAISYKTDKLKNSIWMLNALRGHSNINAFIANNLYRFSKGLIKYSKDFKRELNHFGLQSVSFHTVEEIYKIIQMQFGCPKSQVTVFKQFDDPNGNYISMIAYGTLNNKIPSTYNEKYTLGLNSEKKPFHQTIFESGSSAIRTLSTIEMVKEHFVIFEKSMARENEICQYIGIPIVDSNANVVLLLQIDVSEKNILGKTNNELQELAENIFVPFVQLLYAAYEEERVFDILLTKYSGRSKNKEV